MPLTFTVSEGGDIELKEPDEWYDGTITRIEEYTEGQWGPSIKFVIEVDGDTYQLDDGTDVQRETFAFASQKLSPRSTLYKWASALGWDPETGQLDVTEFENTRCQVMFEHVNKTDEEGNPIVRDRAVKLRKGKGKAKKLKAVKDEEPDDAPF